MRTFIKLISFTLISTLSIANEDGFNISENLQYDSSKQVSVARPTDPNLLWEEYLAKNNLTEGVNTRNDRVFIIASGSSIVGKSINSKNFIDSRTIAYNKAILSAKSELAESLESELKSNRALKIFNDGNETPDLLKEKIIKPLSLMQKAYTLTSLSLDDEIKKFDPEWDGTNKEKKVKLVKLAESVERYTENLSSNARMFLQGASTIFNAEGPVAGDYTIQVGIVWSAKSTRVAESVFNPTVKPPKGKRKLLTIKGQLDKLSNDEIASTLGVRIWWNEKGLPVIVSFASTYGGGSPIIAKKKTALRARTQIAQFVAEQIVSSGSETGGETIHYFDDDSRTAFNEQKFQQSIVAKSKTIRLSGVNTIKYVKIRHPITKKRIAVNIMSWSPESNKLAQGLKKMSRDQKTKMNGVKGGGIFENYQKQEESLPIGSVSTPGLEGVSSDPDDF
jgi:hypothetical protein